MPDGRVRDQDGLREGEGGGAQRDQLDRHAGDSCPPSGFCGGVRRKTALWRCEHMFGTVERWRSTRSCTATPTSRSSTAPATPRSWPRKRHASGWPASRSPTTTASTAWCASRWRPATLGLPTVFGAELTLGIERPPNGEPDPRGRAPASSSPRARRVRRAGPRDQRGAAARGEGRAAHAVDALADARARRCTSTAAEREQRHWFVLTGCRKGTVPAALVRDGPAAARARARASSSTRSVATACSWSCGTTATRSTGTATTRWRRSRCAAGVEVVATNNVHYATPAQRPLATALAAVRAPAFARRDRRLAARRRRSRTCAARRSRRRRFARWPGRGRAHRRHRGARARSTCGSRRRACPTTPCPTATPR